MKRTFLLFFVLMVWSSWLFGQETISCYPIAADYNTGSTNGSDFTETSLIKTTSGGIEVGWARFDISAIPENSIIQSIELNVYVTADNNAYWRAMSLEEDPLLGTAASVYNDCIEGDIYASWTGNFPEPDWWIVDLSAEAVEKIQMELGADGWFGVSIWEYETGGGYSITCDGWNESNPPFIEVTYEETSAPLPPYSPYPANLVIGVEPEVDLSWEFGYNTETYDLYFGTDNPPATKVVDNAAAGASGTYDPGTMDFTTTYYWQVIAKNGSGEAETQGPVWSFTTQCDYMEVPIFEDLEDVTPPDLPLCWNELVNSSSDFASLNTVNYNAYNGSAYCISFYNAEDVNPEVILVSPKILDGVTGKYANFFSYGYGDLSVGTITDPTDASTYTEFVMFDLSNLYLDYQEYEVFFTNYAGDDEYIAFKMIATGPYQEVFLDNVLLDVAPTCPKPTELFTESSATTSATIGWTENGSATQWNIEYGLFGFTPTGTPNVTADSNPFEITGLAPSTVYQCYVQADCGGGDVSAWVGPHTFQTQCDITDVPWFESFESVIPPEIPPCVTIENTNGDNYTWFTTADNSYDGDNAIRINYTCSNSMDDWFFSAPLNLVGGETYIVNFFYTSNSTYYTEKMEVMWGTDASSSAMTEGPIFTDENINYGFVWYEAEAFFTPASDGVYYVGWHGYSDICQYNLYVDDIGIDVAPTCLKPTDLYTLGSTTTTATIGWTENGTATQWNIEYGPFGFTPTGIPNATSNENPFELTGLEPSTVYHFYVQADCGGGDVSWWEGPGQFQTQCDVTGVPYQEGFEAVTVPDIPPCITVENTNGDNFEWYTANDNSYEGDNAIRINYNYAMAMDDWFFSAPLELVGGETYIVQFYYTSNSSFYIEKLEVMWGNGPASTAMTEGPIFVDENINYAFEWYEGVGYFTPETDGVYNVGWHGYSSANQFNLYVDDIIIDVAPTCLKPTGLYTQSTTSSTATVGWIENGDATLWNIEYGPEGFTPTGVATATADSNPYEILDLLPGTAYDFYVQADCGDGDVSWWAGPETFVTLCEPTIVPIEENFDGVIAPALPDCWRSLVESEANSYVNTSGWNGYSVPNALQLENANDPDATVIAISPPVADDEGVAGKYVTFYAWGYASELVVGTISNPYDPSTFTAVSVVPLSNLYGDYQEHEVYFTNYTGTDEMIAFKGVYSATYQTIYIDDVVIDHPPTCPKPTDLSASDVSTSSVVLGWSENGEATTWNIEYGYAGFTPTGVPTITVTENPYTLEGLESGTAYDWYVQADCGAGDLSEWSIKGHFVTLCEPFEVPVFENFDNAPIPDVPVCWTPLVESVNQYAILETVTWNSYSPPASLHFYNSGDAFAEIFAVSPMLTDPVNELWVNFFAHYQYASLAPELVIGAMSDPQDPSTFTELGSVTLSTQWEEYEVFLDEYTGAGTFIALKATFGVTYVDVFVDNITIDHPPTCPKPSDLYAEDATQTTIMIGWEENGSAAQWNVEYGYAGFTPTGVANAFADSNPFELTGLEDGTIYEFYVQADCGGGDESYWVGPHTFQTLCYPIVIASGDYFEDFEGITPPVIPPCIAIENDNNDAFVWQSSFTNPYSGLTHMSIQWNYNAPMDDWFFTAPLELLGGQTYNLVFYYTSSSTYYSENLEARFGDAPESSAMTSDAIFVDEGFSYGGVYQEAITQFTPDEDGVYFVGFHGYSEANNDYIYVDDIFIEWDNSLVVTASADPDSICQGAESQLFGGAVGGSGNYSYNWTSDPPGFSSSDPNPVVTPEETTDYILEVNDSFVSIFDTVTVNVTQLPGMPGTPNGITFFCASWGTATYSTSGATGANWYDWVLEPEDAGMMTGTGTSVSIDWADDWLGMATLKVIGMHDECAGPESQGLNINVYLPDVALDLIDSVGMNWQPFELTGGDPPGGVYTGPGVDDDGWFDPMVAGLGEHIITYTYTDAGLCENSAEDTVTVVQFVGIPEFAGDLDVTINPNPNDGKFKLTVKSPYSHKVSVKVMNNFGEEVYSEDDVELHSNYSTEVDLSDRARGLYYLHIYSDDINHIEKVIVK